MSRIAPVALVCLLIGCDPVAPTESLEADMRGNASKGTQATTVLISDVGADFAYTFEWDAPHAPSFSATALDGKGKPITVYTQIYRASTAGGDGSYDVTYTWPGVAADEAMLRLLSVDGTSVTQHAQVALSEASATDDPPVTTTKGATSHHTNGGTRRLDFPRRNDPGDDDDENPLTVFELASDPGLGAMVATDLELAFRKGVKVPETVAVRFEYPASAEFKVTSPAP